uniref:Uncharacterized protein n=1 Tax=Arion vulgaris TaxID=1028688 RepID=A0A0B6Y128_9EUPU
MQTHHRQASCRNPSTSTGMDHMVLDTDIKVITNENCNEVDVVKYTDGAVVIHEKSAMALSASSWGRISRKSVDHSTW